MIMLQVADDAFGKLVIDELIADGVDTSFIVVWPSYFMLSDS